MIHFGGSIQLVALCPDCEKPMSILTRIGRMPTLVNPDTINSDFVCVYCQTEDCINRGFVSTIEKKSGMVVYTDAMYLAPRGEEQNWKPIYRQFVDREGNVIK